MVLKLMLMFLKIGFLGFGGGYAMLSLILEDSVRLGLTIQQFADLNALDMLIPGPIAINAATYVGYLLGGLSGSIISSLAVSIPSFVFVHLFIYLEKSLKDGRAVQAILASVKVAVVGVICASAFILAKGLVLETPHHAWFVISVIAISLYLQIKKNTDPIILTVVFGILGAIMYYLV